ncbi:ATP-dependent Clp protease proteolytic subunit [Acinetobacter phage ABPH49]|nr:ATP-dependent Clp protease proteolytic subunit [Acinetobacter phage ABPH49]
MNRTNKREDLDGGFMTVDTSSERSIWRREQITTLWEVYLSGAMENHGDHLERIDLIRAASPEDTIRIHLNTPGGVVSIMESYLDAISESQAKIITRAVGQVCSAGTDIWLAGDEREISDRAIFMFHNTQLWTGGDLYNVQKYADFSSRLFKDQLTVTYGEVLTEAELNTIFTGGEVWLRGTDMQRRVEGVAPQQLVGKEIASETEEPSSGRELKIILEDGYSKLIPIDTLSVKDFYEFNHQELKGILSGMGVSPDRWMGVRSATDLAQMVVDVVNETYKRGDQ